MPEDFSFTDEKKPDNEARAGCRICPLTLLPQDCWQNALKPPFRKRHPIIWKLCFLVLLAIAFGAGAWTFSDSESAGGSEKLAFVSITGPIMDTAPTLAWIRKIERNPAVKGILVRVDSPGGGAAASQEIYAAIERVAKKFPVAVSMGSMAASGGLMVSMAGEKIFANPSTVTGSIGVRMDIPQLQGLMGKLGVGQETLVTAPFKNAASYTHPLTPEDRAYLEKVLMNMHDQFVDIVAKSRNMPREKAAALANGKIYTGQEALSLGLIDALGGQDEAHAWLARKTGVPASRGLFIKKESRSRLLERLLAAGKVFGINLDELVNPEKLETRLTQPAFLY